MATTVDEIDGMDSAAARARVMADLKTLAQDAEVLLKATAGDVSESAKAARVRLTAALERAKASYHEMEDETFAKAKVAAKKADTIIREHPYESIGVALGVGLLLGALLARK
jgi:ElaB/YqjD/DUF883 family membrane-anchored ribosome-binding protein